MADARWEVECREGGTQKWVKEVALPAGEMRGLLRLLLCSALNGHEIVEAATRQGGREHLLEIRDSGEGHMWTAGPNSYHYSDRRVS